MDKKSLLILVDYVDLGAIDPLLVQNSDKLAMTSDAMLAFECNKMPFFTFDDFYDYKEFRKDNSKLIDESESFLSDLDKKYKDVIGFPRAFTSNILWFLLFFANIYYVSKICDAIKERYGNIFLAGSQKYDGEFSVSLDFSQQGVAFEECNEGLANRVRMLNAVLKPKCLWGENICRRKRGFNVYKTTGEIFVKKCVKTLLLKGNGFLKKDKNQRKKTIFVIQNGYEVSFLKQRSADFNYKFPIEKLMHDMPKAEIKELEYLFDEQLCDFVERWFPCFSKYVIDLFKLYHQRILGRVGRFISCMEKEFNTYKPDALFYSISATRIYEDICAYLANKKNIPVFYFQHGGTSVFFKHPYQKYSEYSNNVEKINIFHSKVEERILKEKVPLDSRAIGSAVLYDLYEDCKNKIGANKKILYCAGSFNAFHYKGLMTGNSDRELFDINKDVVDTVRSLNLKMDIKIHPSDEDYSYSYFNNLRSNSKKGEKIDINILSGFPIDGRAKNYKLLILDCVGTFLIPVSIVTNMPVILYLKDLSYLREETFSDLQKRFYLVQDRADLEKHVHLFSEGKLDSKFSFDIVDKYSFPIDGGNPCINIPNYIDQKIHENINDGR